MLGILKAAVRMVLAGMPEKEVAEGLVNYLKQRYNLPEGKVGWSVRTLINPNLFPPEHKPMKIKYRIPPKDFSEQEINLYISLRECGDTYGSAVDTIMGERLMKKTFPPEHKPLK